MEFSEFKVGEAFYTAAGVWLCTDIGRRVIVAIRIDPARDPSWYAGPPYAVEEVVFDEYDFGGCQKTPFMEQGL